MTRTAFIHLGGIGDFITSLPALARLAEEGPIEVVGHPERHALAVAAGLAEAAHHLDAVDLASAYEEPSRRFLAFFRRFDRIVAWLRPSPELRNAFARTGAPDIRMFPGLPHAEWKRHASAYYCACLGVEPGPPVVLAPNPGPSQKDMLVIHPGSGGRGKNWPLDCFTAIAQLWAQSGGRTAWLLGPAEEGFRLATGQPVLPPETLVDRARRIAAAGAYLGNDSGISHLAAAAGCPTLAIFGPTDPTVWAPRGPKVAVLQARPWPRLDAVWRALLRLAAPPAAVPPSVGAAEAPSSDSPVP